MTSHHIVWLVNNNEGGGIARATVSLARAARAAGCRTRAVSLADGSMARLMRDNGFDVDVIGQGSFTGYNGSLPRRVGHAIHNERLTRKLVPLIASNLRQKGGEVLHIVSPYLVRLLGPAAQQAGALPVWEMANLISDRYPFKLNQRYYGRVVRRFGLIVIANSRFTASTIGWGGHNVFVNAPSTDADAFDPSKVVPVARSELGFADDQIVLGMFARYVPDKAQHQLIEALARLEGKAHRLAVLLAGEPFDGAYAQDLRVLVGRLGLEGRVTLLPGVHDVERYLADVDLAFNCRLDPEPFGLSVVEAMLMGKPAIVHALGGPAETVVDGQTGWHYHAPTTEALAGAIERALAQKSSWREIGAAARSRALTHYASAATCSQYLRIIEQTRHNRLG
jgi:glycosyltransferase involved in cell wall biosynthesis